MHGGDFNKGVTVTSNATNSPEMQLSVRGRIKAHIEANPNYLTLSKNDKGVLAGEVTLASGKADLQVSEVNFAPSANTAHDIAWQSKLPIPVQFKFVKTDSTKGNQECKYKLSLWVDFKNPEPRYGDFTIKTNHPKKPEITISGMISKS
ncbi:MAG: hypothetical protein PHC61_18725 [Chitinivibrionales bacterium]|nr:hypothetical protein [Chitinivibrionales bacterium]